MIIVLFYITTAKERTELKYCLRGCFKGEHVLWEKKENILLLCIRARFPWPNLSSILLCSKSLCPKCLTLLFSCELDLLFVSSFIEVSLIHLNEICLIHRHQCCQSIHWGKLIYPSPQYCI